MEQTCQTCGFVDRGRFCSRCGAEMSRREPRQDPPDDRRPSTIGDIGIVKGDVTIQQGVSEEQLSRVLAQAAQDRNLGSESLVAKARAALESGDLDHALELSQAAALDDPNCYDAHAVIAEVHRRKGDHVACARAWQKAAIGNPDGYLYDEDIQRALRGVPDDVDLIEDVFRLLPFKELAYRGVEIAVRTGKKLATASRLLFAIETVVDPGSERAAALRARIDALIVARSSEAELTQPAQGVLDSVPRDPYGNFLLAEAERGRLTVSTERHEWLARKRERAAYRGESPGSSESHAYWQVLERNVLYQLHNCAGIVSWLDAHAESIDSQGFRIAFEETQARSRAIVELAAQGGRGAVSAQLGALREAWNRLQRLREAGDAALYEKALEEAYVWSACAQGLVQNTFNALECGIAPDAMALGRLVQSWLGVEPDGTGPTGGGSGASSSQVMRDLGALLRNKPST